MLYYKCEVIIYDINNIFNINNKWYVLYRSSVGNKTCSRVPSLVYLDFYFNFFSYSTFVHLTHTICRHKENRRIPAAASSSRS